MGHSRHIPRIFQFITSFPQCNHQAYFWNQGVFEALKNGNLYRWEPQVNIITNINVCPPFLSNGARFVVFFSLLIASKLILSTQLNQKFLWGWGCDILTLTFWGGGMDTPVTWNLMQGFNLFWANLKTPKKIFINPFQQILQCQYKTEV